ncbi:MAG: 2-5 ligase superfamily, partial [Actinomycetota bacterium]|nr:2-5 ligase superfamily [Actinomycetota bacterium]
GAQRARVLFAGLDDGQGRIADIEALVHASFSAWLPDRQDPYVPHVTLGRCVPPHSVPRGWISAVLPDASFPISSVTLVRSHLRSEGAIYEPLLRSVFGPCSLRSNTCSGKVRRSTRLMTGV